MKELISQMEKMEALQASQERVDFRVPHSTSQLKLSNEAKTMRQLGIEPNSIKLNYFDEKFDFCVSLISRNIVTNLQGSLSYHVQQLHSQISFGYLYQSAPEFALALLVKEVELATATTSTSSRENLLPAFFNEIFTSIKAAITLNQHSKNDIIPLVNDVVKNNISFLLQLLEQTTSFLIKLGNAQKMNSTDSLHVSHKISRVGLKQATARYECTQTPSLLRVPKLVS